MSQGEPWIDRVMQPLSSWSAAGCPLETSEYNRIYEAVGRGSEEQGLRLVEAIVSAIKRAGRRAERANP